MNCVQCIFNLNLTNTNIKCNGFKNQKEYSDFLSLNLESLEKNPLKYNKILNDLEFGE